MDDRFDSVFRDHRFRPIQRIQRKIHIDKRFRGIFSNKSFQENFIIDKRGRPVQDSSSKNLRRFYHLSYADKKRIHEDRKKLREQLRKQLEKTESKDEHEEQNGGVDGEDSNKPGTYCGEFGDLGDVFEQKQNFAKAEDVNYDYEDHDSDSSVLSSDEDSDIDLARGKGNVESSSDEEDIEDVLNNNIREHEWGELDVKAPRSEETSRRLALCNMDWDRVRAADIFMLLDSFKPTGGSIDSVVIYPSEYGSKRMEEENKMGPAELKELKAEYATDDPNKREDEQYNMEKLREYQLNRLKYYYAVVTCDSAVTAEKVYNECDGIEYEASSSKLDLRFVPDEMEFNDFPPKDTATSAPDTLTYKPASFVTAALNQTKVALTWDETDHSRTKFTKSNFSKEDLESMDVRDFLASSSGSESEGETSVKRSLLLGNPESKNQPQPNLDEFNEEDRVAFYRNTLLGNVGGNGDSDDDDIDMEVTWEPDLKETVEQDLMKEETVKRPKRKELQERKIEDSETKQAELEMIMLQDDIGDKDGKATNKEFEINVDDKRFSALYRSSNFAIDRSNSLFRKTEAMEMLVQERQQRVKKEKDVKIGETSKTKINKKEGKNDKETVSQLVKSIKSKSAFLDKKKPKK